MKKLLFLIITLAYFISTSGATVYIHECMGEVVNWDFHNDEKDKCGNCGMHKNASNDCCNDEIKILKISGELKQPETGKQPLLLKDVLLPIAYFSLNLQKVSSIQKKPTATNCQMSDIRPTYCILYCTFLI